MKRSLLITLVAFSFALAGCSDRPSDKAQAGQPKPVDKVVAAEADNLFSDAAFAMQLKDYPRAEKALEKAVDLRSDIPEWWELLGYVHKLQDHTSQARSSYKKAYALWEKRYDKTGEAEEGMRQLFLLVMLDRIDEARSFAEKLAKNHPNDMGLQNFVKTKGVDRMLADPDVQKKKL